MRGPEYLSFISSPADMHLTFFFMTIIITFFQALSSHAKTYTISLSLHFLPTAGILEQGSERLNPAQKARPDCQLFTKIRS